MKKLILSLLLFPSLMMAQTYFNVDFGGTFPPSGWTIDAHVTNWSAVSTNNSGGTAPEARFNWDPSFVGDSRLISSAINTTGKDTVATEFKFMLDHNGGPYTIGVATRSGGGAWNVVWQEVNPTGSISATTEIAMINNNDVGAADFQICWFFSGDSYNINYWYLDDLKLFVPLAHDAMVKDILVDPTYPPGTNFTPQAILKNFGLNTDTLDATCVLKVGGSKVYTQNCPTVTLASGEEQTVSFPAYVLNASNDLYEITVSTNLFKDMDPTNDARTEYFSTTPVPVELTSFTAEATTDGVLLKWATATELNNHGFEIERSLNGTEFYTVAFIQGAGTTTEGKEYSYTDEVEYKGGETFYYRLKQVDLDGSIEYSSIIEVEFDIIPRDFVLHQNFPNPFNPSTTIKYAVPKTSSVSIKVYDLTGQEIAPLVNEVKEAGTYELKFDASNLASGVYIYRMIAGDFSSVKKMNLLK